MMSGLYAFISRYPLAVPKYSSVVRHDLHGQHRQCRSVALTPSGIIDK